MTPDFNLNVFSFSLSLSPGQGLPAPDPRPRPRHAVPGPAPERARVHAGGQPVRRVRVPAATRPRQLPVPGVPAEPGGQGHRRRAPRGRRAHPGHGAVRTGA